MYRKDQVMNMAKAKIVKRKRRLRIEGLATLLLTLSIFGYFGAKFALKSYNITLQLKAQESEQKAKHIKRGRGKSGGGYHKAGGSRPRTWNG